jgi:hypothetical protein
MSAAANAYMKSFKAGRGRAGGGYELEKGELGDTSAGYSDQNENIRPMRRGDAALDTPECRNSTVPGQREWAVHSPSVGSAAPTCRSPLPVGPPAEKFEQFVANGEVM